MRDVDIVYIKSYILRAIAPYIHPKEREKVSKAVEEALRTAIANINL